MRLVFKVRVLTKDAFTDTFASFKSIIGGRIKAYEKLIERAIQEASDELYKQYPKVKNVRIATTEMIKDGCEIIVYGEIE